MIIHTHKELFSFTITVCHENNCLSRGQTMTDDGSFLPVDGQAHSSFALFFSPPFPKLGGRVLIFPTYILHGLYRKLDYCTVIARNAFHMGILCCAIV